MSGINKVIIIGRLTKDPESRALPSGDSVCNFSVATSKSWKNKQGEKQEETEFHNIVTFKRTAEIAGMYLRKGSKVYLEGSLKTSSWKDKDSGVKRYKTEINAFQIEMLDSKGDRAETPTQQPKQIDNVIDDDPLIPF